MFSHTRPLPSSLSEVSSDVSLEVAVTGDQYSTQDDNIYNRGVLFLDISVQISSISIYLYMHYNARNVIKAQYSCVTYNTSVKMPVWRGRSAEHKWVFWVRLQPTYFVWVRCWVILQYTVGHVRACTHTHGHKSNYNTLMHTYAAYLLISFTDSLHYSHTASRCFMRAHTGAHLFPHTLSCTVSSTQTHTSL